MVEEKSTSKKTTKTVSEEPKKKSQKVNVLLSVYRYGDKIVSSLGIPSKTDFVTHHLPKNKLKPEDLFNILTALNNERDFKGMELYKQAIEDISNIKQGSVRLPKGRVHELKKIGNLIHEILNVEIELFIK